MALVINKLLIVGSSEQLVDCEGIRRIRRNKIKNMMKSKKSMSTIIVVLLLIVLSLSAIFMINYSVKKIAEDDFGDKVSCFDSFAITQSFFIEKACYLNDNEILVNVERRTDGLNVEALKFAFIGEETTKWVIRQEKCTDARTLNSSYGGYCSVLVENMERGYVFKVSDLEVKNEVKLVIEKEENDKRLSCLVDSKDIEARC